MRIPIFFIALVVFLLALVSAANTQGRNKQHKVQPSPPAVQPDSEAIVDLPPAPPPTPEQGPSSPPEVNFQNGQLTIVARNSTMSDVLNAVKQKTGASVDMPTVSSERVVGRFGPGSPREVMAQLLNGSHYDYVLLGSPADPGALEKVVLMARVSGPEPSPQAAQPVNPPPVYNQPLAAVPEVETETQDEAGTEEAPVMPPEMQPGQEDQSQAPERQQPMVKTPEQLLRELQQQQQQQQEQQQPESNLPPGAPGQPPQ